MVDSDLDRARHHFLSKVNKQTGRKVGELSECWFRDGSRNSHGYCDYQTNYIRSKDITTAHCASYFLFRDQTFKPSREMPISHLCENTEVGSHRACCNPEHLVWKSRAENIADRDANLGAYQPKGADAAGAKFNLDEARAIQQRHLAGEEYSDIAKSLDVNRRTVERICCGHTYVELGDCRPILAQRRRDLDERIRKLASEGVSRKEISKQVGRSASYLSGVLSDKKAPE